MNEKKGIVIGLSGRARGGGGTSANERGGDARRLS